MNPTLDFGIDLGTTNSSVACCRAGQVKLFPTNEMMTVTPSVVYIAKTGRMLVGKRAYDTWPADPENTQAEFKRWMGFSDKLLFPASNRTMSAEELSAEVLKSRGRRRMGVAHILWHRSSSFSLIQDDLSATSFKQAEA
jgi:molecular chaperone DnaK